MVHHFVCVCLTCASTHCVFKIYNHNISWSWHWLHSNFESRPFRSPARSSEGTSSIFRIEFCRPPSSFLLSLPSKPRPSTPSLAVNTCTAANARISPKSGAHSNLTRGNCSARNKHIVDETSTPEKYKLKKQGLNQTRFGKIVRWKLISPQYNQKTIIFLWFMVLSSYIG